MASVSIVDLFTADEISKGRTLWKTLPAQEFHKRAKAEIIQPAMPRIATLVGHENDPSYLSYALEYLIGRGA